jgi:hypothetical protein
LAEPQNAPGNAPRPGGPADALRATLERAASRLLVFGGAEAVLAGATGLAAGLGLALLAVGVLPFSLELRATLWALIGVSGVVGLGLVVWRRILPLRDPYGVARHLEEAAFRQGHALGDEVRGAVELLDESEDERLGRSRALCDAHIAQTNDRLREARAMSSLGGVALGDAVPTLLSAATAVFVAGAVVLGLPIVLEQRWAKLFDDAAAEDALKQRAANLLPLVTDLSLTLRFPGYMGREDQTIVGASGDVTAPRGTEVVLQGRADRSVKAAAILVGEQEIVATVEDGRTIKGGFTIERGGSYRFRLTEPDGDEELDPVAHKITLAPDKAPEVELSEPAEDMTVRLEDEIALAFGVKDDFGVTKVRVVVRRQGSSAEPWQEDVASLELAPRELRSSARFIVADTGARPGDRLSVYVEADDNDTVSGPKVGRSRTRVLTVFSAAEHHRKLIELQERLLDKLVHLLGDELEAPLDMKLRTAEPEVQTAAVAPHAKVNVRAKELIKLLDELLTQLADDELSPPQVRRALANMRTELARPLKNKAELIESLSASMEQKRKILAYVWRHVSTYQRESVELLEKHALYLEDLLNTQRLKEAEQIAAEMKQTQEQLKELIDQYKKSPDDQTREAILEEIQRLRKQMQELMKRLAELQRDVPDEYLNEEAFQTDEMMKNAQDLDTLIEEGKLEEAAKQLEQMVEQTQKLLDGLEENREEYGGDEYKELRDKLEKFGQELSALEAAQQELLHKTERQLDAARKEAEKRLKGELEKKLKQLLEKAKKANGQLKECDTAGLYVTEQEDAAFAQARAEDLQAALESGDLEDAVQSAEEAASAARSAERSVADRTEGRFGSRNKRTLGARDQLRKARPILDDIAEELREMLPDPAKMLSKRQREQMKKDAQQQGALKDRADKLNQMMKEIGKEMPIFGPQHNQKVDDAGRKMRQASRYLRNEDLRDARGAQQKALQGLGDLREALEQMSQQGGQGGGGLPMPLPGGSGMEPSGGESSSGRSSSQQKVEIPGADEFEVPPEFRKDILDAMREGAPEDWQGEVRRYYEELVK